MVHLDLNLTKALFQTNKTLIVFLGLLSEDGFRIAK